MRKNRILCVGLSIAFALSLCAAVATSLADCVRSCHTFKIEIAYVDPPKSTLPFGAYCLDYGNDDRGGMIYDHYYDLDLPVNGQEDPCHVYKAEDCPSICTDEMPRVAFYVEPGSNSIDWMTKQRYDCETDYSSGK